MRRVGPAWLTADGTGGWTPRKGRVPATHYDEKRAMVAMAALIERDASDFATVALEDRRRKERPVTFREVAAAWLEWLAEVKGAKPSTLRDYRSILAEPGAPHARGGGKCEGRILAAFGDRPAAAIETADVSTFLRGLDRAGLMPRNVNKHRQVVSAIFTFAQREDTYALAANPVSATDKRCEAPASVLDYFEP
jgi:hypothetical protein